MLKFVIVDDNALCACLRMYADFFSAIFAGLTVNKEPVVGVIYNPILDHMYHARKDHGAFLNDEKISASGEKGGNMFGF